MLIELLREGASHAGGQPVVLASHRALTYRECLDESARQARGLAVRAIDRFGLVADDLSAALPTLCASSATGSEACVYPTGRDDDAVEKNARAFDHQVIVSDRPLLLSQVEVVPLSALATAEGSLPGPPEFAPVLILTTGTTGRPKGARHDWRRMVAALRHSEPEPGARWLFVYNLNQFAGIQVLLHVLATHGTLVVPPTNRPHDAVATMRDLGVTHASATPTFWRMVVNLLDRATAAAVPLRQITLGGEAVPAPLLSDLARLFPAARISQVYGATEFGLTGTVRDGRSGLPVSVLDRGADANVQFRIVEGELYTRSRIGMLGYYGEPDIGDEWRATGDLVEVRGDRLHFVGRSTEVINVGGVKVHPLPIEELVAAVDGVALVRVYGRASAVTGQIVAADVVARAGADADEVGNRIRAACEHLPPAAQPRRLRFVSDIVRQHKIDRRGTGAMG